jgi:streptogrisin C
MKINKILGVAVAAAATAGALVVGTTPASAAPDFAPLNAEMVPAMQRDLGLTHDQAIARVTAETAATGLEQSLSAALGDSYGGASFDALTGKLSVGVTDAAKLAQVRANGAEAKLVRFSAKQLDSTVDILNAGEATAPKSLTSWGVDTVGNRITVTVAPGQVAAADAYITKSGVDRSAVTVVEATDAPKLQYDVRGGDAYYIANQARCSIGFSTTSGFLSAGHCAAIGSSLTGYNQVAMGSFTRYSFPTNDYSLAAVNSNWVPRGVINNGTRVSGSTAAATGASVCKSGSTTAVTCGTIGAKNQTVRYAEGTVYGMTATNVRSAAGDSGGSLYSGNQAQGLLSGGNTTVTYFFPVNAALSGTGARLVLS